ncbi:SDR family oxidoreductase [Nocardia sp. CDC159]|uniref:Enoyl-[acyl-carrier-protein] reductase [NADH] n=1 Tax=Nocardia pulmonis TaxID=2951408 RepID=A0A9X2E4Y4_9NOCA|nr:MULTISPECIES: SDR family oxidoreductase [Nocardia]MCM6774314.1 SDR family oxidoreductase [Nocardia pulmonis]MCM6787620.1 SDR family oxidoreductase [Nocardia sp. CDC159]
MIDLSDRRYLITGVLNHESIAWHVCAALQRCGAQTLVTAFGRGARIARRAAELLPTVPEVIEFDAGADADFAALRELLEQRWGSVDGVLHSIAHASPDSLGGQFMRTPAADALAGFRISAYSFQQLATTLEPLLARSEYGGSMVGLTIDASRVLVGYDWMGVHKAALEAVVKYAAVYLGPSGIRANLVAAGPVETVSAHGVSTFGGIADYFERAAPLGWDRRDPGRVVGAVLFLLSDLSRYTTGQVVYADGGVHAVVGGIDLE